MATYKGINGFAVQSVATDPSPLDEGQVWYNNATYAFKLAAIQAAAWASGGNYGASFYGLAGAGTQTAGLGFGGYGPISSSAFTYNGTSWSPSPSLNTARMFVSGFGTQTAAVAVAGASGIPQLGNITGATEKYNGTSWTNNPTGLNTTRFEIGTFGTSTAGIGAGGYTPGSVFAASAESWDGSSWTTISSMNTGRSNSAGAGTQTAGLIFMGQTSPPVRTGATELWNGTKSTAPIIIPYARWSFWNLWIYLHFPLP